MSTAEKIKHRDQFEDLLRLWGWWYGEGSEKRKAEYEELEAEAATGAGLIRSPGQGIFERKQSEDPLVAVIRLTHSMDRGGLDRRRLQGQAAGLTDRKGQVAPAPSWASDPVRCAETRSKRAERIFMPPQAIKVETAVMALHSTLEAHGRAFRVNYCTYGTNDEKAERLGMGKNKFRELVAEARGWVRCRMAC